MNNTLMYKLGAFAALQSTRTKLADADVAELLGALGLSVGVPAAMTAGIGAARSGIIGDRGPQRRDLAAGLRGDERGLLRRMFEHTVNPAGASAYAKGQQLKKQLGSKADPVAEKLQQSYDTSPFSKILRGLQYATAPLTVPFAPVLAGPNALVRLFHSLGLKHRAAKSETGDLHQNTLGRMGGGAVGGLLGMMPVVHGATLGDRLREAAGKPITT